MTENSQFGQHKISGDENDDNGYDNFRNEGQRLLLNLRQGLKKTNQQTDYQTRQQRKQ